MSTDEFAKDFSDRVRQAQVMVAESAKCSLDEALELMTGDADLSDESLEQVADDILSGRVQYGPPE
jgi:hypothetical protein